MLVKERSKRSEKLRGKISEMDEKQVVLNVILKKIKRTKPEVEGEWKTYKICLIGPHFRLFRDHLKEFEEMLYQKLERPLFAWIHAGHCIKICIFSPPYERMRSRSTG